MEANPAGDDAVDFDLAVQSNPHLHLRKSCSQVGAAGVADHQVTDLLRAKADLVEPIGRSHPATGEFPRENVRRDRPTLDPHHRNRNDEHCQQGKQNKPEQPRPATLGHDHGLVRGVLARPLVHSVCAIMKDSKPHICPTVPRPAQALLPQTAICATLRPDG